MRSGLLLLSVAVLAAGCFSANTPPQGGSTMPSLAPIPEEPLEQDHDHSDPAEHNLTVNFELVGHHSGYGSGGNDEIPAPEGFSELFVRGGLAFLGRRGGNDGGFVILNVDEPEHPAFLAAFQGLANYDMESTYDNKYVFFVSQYLNNQQQASVPPRGPGDVPRQIHLIDITTPSEPQYVGPIPGGTRGAHTITYYRTDAGRELVAAQEYDFLPDPSLGLPVAGEGSNPANARVVLFDFKRTPEPHLEPISAFEQHPTDQPLGDYFPHDVIIQKHPITGQLLMYVAYWNLGGYIVDISDPATPTIVSRVTDFHPSGLAQVHMIAPASELIQGRHITVTEPELGGGEPETGQLTIFDTTDPAHPKRLGFWTLPGHMANPEGLRFSPHNFEIHDGRIYLAHYHAGVWLIDIATNETLESPVTLAFAQPNLPRPGYAGDMPNVWSAIYQDGLVYASDIAGGLYIYHYLGDPAFQHVH